MTPAEIIAIAKLIAVLEPPAAALLAQIIGAFQSSGLTAEERQTALNDLSQSLKPMVLKP